MKKELIVISLIFVLMLTGCGKKELIEDNFKTHDEELSEVNEIEANEIENNKTEDNNDENENYELTKGYYLDNSALEKINYNILSFKDIINESYKFVSDGKEFEIICKKVKEYDKWNSEDESSEELSVTPRSL